VPNLHDTINALTTVSLAGGSLVLDLSNGAVTVDLASFLAFHGIDVNGLPANTDLTSIIDPLLGTDLVNGLTSNLNSLTTTLTSAINGTTITLAGIPVSAGTLSGALAPILTALTSALSPVTSTIGSSVVTPLLSAVDQLAQITVNAQSTSGGTFTETALAVSVVPANPVVALRLASASVGPNAGPAPVNPPTATGLDPNRGPTAGGQTVTMTGTHFVSGSTTLTIGGNTIPANQVTVAPDGLSLTFATPPHAAGPVNVTATTTDGTTAPLTYTYIPAPPVITAPADGSTVSTATPAIRGTGTPTFTVTVTENGTDVCSGVVDSAGTWTCTPSSPLRQGAHTVTATQTNSTHVVSEASDPVTFTVSLPVTPTVTPTTTPTVEKPTVVKPTVKAVQPQPTQTPRQAGTIAQTGNEPVLALMGALFAIIAGALLIIGGPMVLREQ